MSEQLETVIRRVKKLLQLARSDNPHEAAAAAAEAQRLLTLHGLEEGELGSADAEEIESGLSSVLSGVRLAGWCIRLAAAISIANQCRALVHSASSALCSNKSIRIYGHRSDVAKVRYLYEYYHAETIRLADKHGAGRGLRWRESFRHGVVDTVGSALIRSARSAATEVSCTALVRLDTRLGKVDAYIAAKADVKGTVTGEQRDENQVARALGQAAGRNITPNEARAALEEGERA